MTPMAVGTSRDSASPGTTAIAVGNSGPRKNPSDHRLRRESHPVCGARCSLALAYASDCGILSADHQDVRLCVLISALTLATIPNMAITSVLCTMLEQCDR